MPDWYTQHHWQGQHLPQTFGDEHSKLQKKTKMKVCDRFQVLEEITELCTKFNVLKMSSAQAVISHSLQTEFYKLLSTSLRWQFFSILPSAQLHLYSCHILISNLVTQMGILQLESSFVLKVSIRVQNANSFLTCHVYIW